MAKGAQTIREVMTPSPTALPSTATAVDAARAMRDDDIGDVVVLDADERVCGILTDRDVTVRVVAEGRDPAEVQLEDICSRALVTLAPTDSVEDAVRTMRRQALRRLPVVEGAKPVGIVSLGDLALTRDRESALADISAAPANT
jgi:CBS domain-containing protein